MTEKLFSVIENSINLVEISIWTHKLIAMKALLNLYRRFHAIVRLLLADSYVLVTPTPNKPTSIHHNSSELSEVVQVLAGATIELHQAEQVVDTMTNELGIKRLKD